MAIILFLTFFNLFSGRLITGIPTLMLIPAIVGLGVMSVWRSRQSGRGRAGMWGILVVCAAAVILCLYVGIPDLLNNFR